MLIDPGDMADSAINTEKVYHRIKAVYDVLGIPDRVNYAHTSSHLHAYYEPERKAALGWFNKWLKGIGDGNAVTQLPSVWAENQEILKVWPDGTRPGDFKSFDEFVHDRISAIAANYPAVPVSKQDFIPVRQQLTSGLQTALKRMPPVSESIIATTVSSGPFKPGSTISKLILNPESMVHLPVVLLKPDGPGPFPVAIISHWNGKGQIPASNLDSELLSRGWAVALADLRDTGETLWNAENGGWLSMRDLSACSQALNLDRTMAGLWVYDIRRVVDYLTSRADIDKGRIAVVGFGDTGISSMFAGALDPRIWAVVEIDALASYVSPGGFGGHYIYNGPDMSPPPVNVASFVPQIMNTGDLPHFAACVVPKALCVLNPVSGDKFPMPLNDAAQSYAWTRDVFRLYDANERFAVITDVPAAAIGVTAAQWLDNMPLCVRTIETELTSDCYVNFADLARFSEYWINKQCDINDCGVADLNNDNSVDIKDFSELASEWMSCSNSSDPTCW